MVRVLSGEQFPLPPFNLNLTLFTSFLPLFNLNLTSASSGISSHGLETTVYRPLVPACDRQSKSPAVDLQTICKPHWHCVQLKTAPISLYIKLLHWQEVQNPHHNRKKRIQRKKYKVLVPGLGAEKTKYTENLGKWSFSGHFRFFPYFPGPSRDEGIVYIFRSFFSYLQA